MRQCSFCDKNCINFGIKLDAEISIWMQSRFDGFDFSATLDIWMSGRTDIMDNHVSTIGELGSVHI